MQAIEQALMQTPWWVYVLFFSLVWMGIKATQPRVLPLKILFIMPILFFGLSIHSLFKVVTIDSLSIGCWTTALMISAILGIYQIINLPIKVDKNKFLVALPGTWMTLILILVIFAAKYYFDYQLAVEPEVIHKIWFELTMLITSGVCTGLFTGRLAGFLYRFKVEPHSDLLR